MTPEQPAPPPPASNYDFIVNPKATPKKPLIGGKLGGNPFILKLIFIIGGAALAMAALGIAVSVIFGDKTNLVDLTALAATEQEIIRVSEQGENAGDQVVRYAAMNTRLSLKTHQQAWVTFLAEHGQTTKREQLILKKDVKTDEQLTQAQQNSSFDAVFSQIMRGQLEGYAEDLKVAYNHAVSKTERTQLNNQYRDVALLLTQWPE